MNAMGFTGVSAALLIISVAAALSYGLLFLRRDESALRSLTKTAAIGALAALAWFEGAPWLLIAALALSAVGDFAISRDGEGWFTAGLASFLLAHIAYVPLFVGIGEGLDGWRIAGAALVLIHATVTTRWLWPHLGPMRGPVAAYVLAIAAMGLTALTAPPALWPVLAGAALFIASDTALAAETFVFREAPRRWTAPFVWSTYFAGQALIASAWICGYFAP